MSPNLVTVWISSWRLIPGKAQSTKNPKFLSQRWPHSLRCLRWWPRWHRVRGPRIFALRHTSLRHSDGGVDIKINNFKYLFRTPLGQQIGIKFGINYRNLARTILHVSSMLNLRVSTYKIQPSTILVEAFSTCVEPSAPQRAREKVLLCHLVDGHGLCTRHDGREPKKCCCDVPPLHDLVLCMIPLSNLDWMSWGLE